MELNFYQYENFKETSLHGRYITNDSIKHLKKLYSYTELGTSTGNKPIFYFKLGSGTKKILIWTGVSVILSVIFIYIWLKSKKCKTCKL